MVFPAVQRGFTVFDRLRAGAERHSFFRQREHRGEQTVVPEPTEITGKMALPEEDIAAVDAWLKDWVQIQGKHAEGSTLNDNMTILESKTGVMGSLTSKRICTIRCGARRMTRYIRYTNM